MTEKELVDMINNLGGSVYLVGGAVRDKYLGKTPKDRDYVIVGVPDISKIPFVKEVGKSFPVYIEEVDHVKCEIAIARKEISTGEKTRDFTFDTRCSVSITDDLSRRDLTINSMAINLKTEDLVDPFDGLTDLRNKVLRHTSEAFKEDPLRVFRLARFISTFPDFSINFNTINLCFSMSDLLDNMHEERVYLEMKKALMGKKPSNFFNFLHDIDCLRDKFFKEINDLFVPDKHDGTAYEHTMRILDKGTNLNERFGCLFHDFGKGRTPKEMHPSHFGHDELGIGAVNSFCDRLRVPNKYRKIGILCSKEHMRIKHINIMRGGKIFILFSSYTAKEIEILMKVSYYDSFFREGADKIKAEHIVFLIAIKYFRYMEANKAITGKMLIKEGIKPSPNFKETLQSRRIHYFMNLNKEL